ncbi:ABC transporter ATP-binding protein/permease [Luteolibacter sp. GHJ8]|uniref:ABC transporter ATP-binding protein/permease n=1 Tax=Luteolibacter rhizosphaerae TaxID=2989719 RepID=A0ABT3G548_9BACT|nr:ABC transporter ATP-binding protein [Luteolibacter rhizosphaerae]MCW1914991.1 ABC transporter ATP-binding protein/permease [Luteolibacter rhizosphaerae]
MAVLKRVFSLALHYPGRAATSLVMAVICTVLVLVLPTVTQVLVDEVMDKGRRELLFQTASLGIGAILLRQTLFMLRTYGNNALEQRLIHDLRKKLYDKLQRLPIKWFDTNSSGEIMSRVASDVPSTDRVIVETIDQAIPAVLQFLIMAGWMFYNSWELALVTLAPLPIIGLITTIYSKRAEPRWRESSEASAALNALLHDNLAGIRQIKAYTVEPEALDRFDAASRHVGEKHMRVMKGQALVWPGVSLLAESGIILMLACGAWWVLEGKMEKGTPMAFLVAWGFLFDPISRINNLTQLYVSGKVAAKRVFDILDLPDETNLTEGERPAEFKGKVVFENAGFSYDPDSPAVQGVSLIAEPGMTVALVGPTGAGKSTVLNLLTRFYETDQGRILLDDHPIETLSKEWLRDHTGYVTQESFLFNTTLRENLRLAKPDATDDEIWAALDNANAAPFVRDLPEKLDTVAGERGVRFSGGEKQRLSIARALLKNPPLLLLDEATSALDNETERLVQQALENLRADRTSFVIAHRLSTVRKADLICVLQDGKLVECGKHEDLLARGGLYSRLCEASIRE